MENYELEKQRKKKFLFEILKILKKAGKLPEKNEEDKKGIEIYNSEKNGKSYKLDNMIDKVMPYPYRFDGFNDSFNVNYYLSKEDNYYVATVSRHFLFRTLNESYETEYFSVTEEEFEQYLRNQEFVKKALDNAKKINMGEKTYLDVMLDQRIEGPNNAGSSYNVRTSEELYNNLIDQNWVETEHSDVMSGCRVFKSTLPGLEGILDLDTLPDDVELYAIDPKNTGKIGMGAGKVKKKAARETYLIIGKENIDGVDEDVVFTFHPGEPVRPSQVETTKITDGTRLTKKEAKSLGFDKVKYLSDEMLKEYRGKKINIAKTDEDLGVEF